MPASFSAAIVDELICSALRGEAIDTPAEADSGLIDTHIRAHGHGVEAILYDRLKNSNWPLPVVAPLRARAFRQAIWEAQHQQIVGDVLRTLAEIDVHPILIKGTALAYSLYRTPALRARSDTDLLIAPADRDQTHQALIRLGFDHVPGVTGEFVSYQASYTTTTAEGTLHALDLHWKINNSELLSKLFTYEELRGRAAGVPQLSPDALGASRVDALLIACMHRLTHKQNPYYVNGVAQYGGDRLIWIYDLHLLATCLEEREWQDVLRLAREKGLGAVCLEGLQRSQECFHSAIAPTILAALAAMGDREAPARYLSGSKLRQQWMDFCALERLRSKMKLMKEIMFPPAAYMRAKYPQGTPRGLPWLYVRRIMSGLLKRFRQGNGAR